MTDTDILEHSGVKGMKWGVRNDKGHEGESAKTKKIAKLDKKFEKNASSLNTTLALHNRAAELANSRVDAINNKSKYKGQDFTRDSPLRQSYYKEHQKSFLDGVTQAAKEMGTNASGTKQYTIIETTSGGWDVYVTDVQHADEKTPEFSVDVDYDDMGHIRKVMLPETAAHADDVEEFLAHYGVKGQRWGVRRRQSQANRDHATNRKLAAMSDAELQKTVNRIRMEKQYKDLEKSKIKKGHDTAKTILAVGATVNAAIAFSKSPAGKVIASSIKKEQTLMPLRALG